jgi:hypothetical protein
MLLLVLAGLASCGGSSGPGAANDAQSTVVKINNDAPSASDDAGPPDAPVPSGDAQASSDGGEVTASLSYDGGSSDCCWMDPSLLFPDCMTFGTSDEISNCIINLPTNNGGIPVTRPDPMAYSACKP